ncbi:hypothetical protein M0R72_14840 [Candidatus Pacearchaeota archaeon]|jgi:hypothetical protein|nr:hypothetical protein [Candidatus Pacearchaeota archaeon]
MVTQEIQSGVSELLSVVCNVALIRNPQHMTAKQALYWNTLARKLGKRVDVVDPWRADMKMLRAEYPLGTRVYRASTGGRWGRSAEIVTL